MHNVVILLPVGTLPSADAGFSEAILSVLSRLEFITFIGSEGV
jgi:hypothetical protein